MSDMVTKEFVIKAIKMFNDNLIEKLNTNFNHVSKRFDDMDKRLETIESRLNIMSKDTQIIPKIFDVLEDDGIDIAKLTVRVDKLDP